MERNSSLLMVGEVFEYRVSLSKPGQNIGYISDQLYKLGLVAKLEKWEREVIETSVRRLTDPKGTKRYVARVAEWGSQDDYHDIEGKPWHVYVGKIVSEDYAAVDLAIIEEAINEIKEDFPNAKVLHCTRPIIYLE